ncbi:MAG: hypothetical protein ABIH03_09000 [Pseudomonadota bacterium]
MPYKWWKADDGTSASGAGEMELRIAPDGVVDGNASGALGNMIIRGILEEDGLRAGVSPTDPGSETSMTGVLVGAAKQEAIEADLRVSSHDASLVRRAVVRLKRK